MSYIDLVYSELERRDRAETKVATSFWAGDAEKDAFEIYHQWKGTKPSNPFQGKTLLMFEVGKQLELSIVKTLIDKGSAYDYPDEKQHRIEMERHGVPISGYMDAVLTLRDVPLEIKSFYGYNQEKEIKDGTPKLSYLKQLAIYMDYMDKDEGRLIYVHRGTGDMYEFFLMRKKNIFTCGPQSFDLDEVYKRYASIHKDYILQDIEPPSDYRYKYDIETLDWGKVKNDDIKKARNNQAVLGDWQVKYSLYKDKIVAKEAEALGKDPSTYLGYTDAELARICDLTAGYTAKKK